MNRFDGKLKYRAHIRLIFSIITLIMTMMMLIACQKTSTIKIGIVGTMTGANSDLSISGRRGVEIAVEEINQKGGIDGRKVELVVKDDKNDPEVALQKDQEFVAEGIQLIIGHYTSGMMVPSMDYINSQEILMVGPTISNDNFSGKDDNFIRLIASTKEQAMVLTDMAQKLNHNRVTILYDERNKGFTDQLVLNYQYLLKKKMGEEANVLSFNPQKSETLDQALKEIEAEAPKGLFVIASAEDCAKVAGKIKTILPKLQLYAPLWANTSELVRKGGTAVEGMMVVDGINRGVESDKFIEFRQVFNNRYGEEPTFASIYSYETMMALGKAIKEAKSQQPVEVKRKLIEISVFEGVQNRYSIDAYGDNTRQYQISKIQQGVLRKVE